MSIEEKLKCEYKRLAQNLSAPAAMRSEVMEEFRNEFGSRAVGKGGRRPPLKRIAIYAAVILLLSGFAYGGGKVLFQEREGLWGIQIRSAEEAAPLGTEAVAEIRRSLREVREQLQPGESAVVYLAALADSPVAFYRHNPMMGVKQPLLIAQKERIDGMMNEDGFDDLLPESLSGGYHFQSGYKGEPSIRATIGVEGMEAKDTLSKEVRTSGEKYSWKKVRSHEQLILGYTYLYQNESGKQLLVMVEALTEEITLQTVAAPGSKPLERLDIGGASGVYAEQNDSPFVESGYYQELTWTQLKEAGESKQYVYRVGSEQSSVTKEELLAAAEGLARP
ncbi:hypothetical protein ACFQZE_20515 [Paenibacillus sp. GCM10027627]|uniref:hypothetical protein n=1 Tax=unclassified Paenibacillus TaxID=185978 RepID=UPI003628236B